MPKIERVMEKNILELVQAIRDLYFKTGERVLFDGYYKLASWCEEGDWLYVVYYRTEDDEWETPEDCSGSFFYFDDYTKEVTSIEDITLNWIVPFIMEDMKKWIELNA